MEATKGIEMKAKKKSIIKCIIIYSTFIAYLLVGYIAANKLIMFYASETSNEVMNTELFEFLINSYYADDDYVAGDYEGLSLEDRQHNLESSKNYFDKRGVDTDSIPSELLSSFKQDFKTISNKVSETDYEIGKLPEISIVNYNYKWVYEDFLQISKVILTNNEYTNYEDHLQNIEGSQKIFIRILIGVTVAWFLLYYIIKFNLHERKINFKKDIGVLILLVICFAVLFLSLLDQSDIFSYIKFIDEIQNIDKITITTAVYFDVVYQVLKAFIIEFTAIILLMITIGEFLLARAVYRKEALALGNMYMLLLEE